MTLRLLVLAVVLSVTLSAPTRAAAAADPLETAACRAALDSLQRAEAAAASAPRAGSASIAPIQGARRDAARACLGGSGDAPPLPRQSIPSVGVPPVGAARPAVTAAPTSRRPPSSLAVPMPMPMPVPVPVPAPAPARVPVPAPQPLSITTCDAVACWGSDGSRLNRVGPNLIGPRGLCTVQGTLLNCR